VAESIFSKLFGLGKIPRRMVPVLEQEGIVLAAEGLSGSVTLRNFSAPGRRSFFRRNWFVGSLVITEERVAALTPFRPLVNLPLEKERLADLQLSLLDEETLSIGFDASTYHEEWSGSVEMRFSTPKARLFLEQLQRHSTQ
jgi:hypothetical protein